MLASVEMPIPAPPSDRFARIDACLTTLSDSLAEIRADLRRVEAKADSAALLLRSLTVFGAAVGAGIASLIVKGS